MLSSILHYLRASLISEAVKVISSVEIINDNYEVAWNLLKQRYENKKLIVQYLIQTLLDLSSINRESYILLRYPNYILLRILVDNVQYV